MRKRNVVLLSLLVIFLTSCSTITPQYFDQMGRQLPVPSYTMKVVGTPMIVTFYYAAFEEEKDVDGSTLFKPTYLDMFKFNNILADKVKRLQLIIEVNNPSKIEYQFYQQMFVEIGDAKHQVSSGKELNKSDRPYRMFVYNLPLGNGVNFADHSVIMSIDGQNVMRIGDFKYKVIYPDDISKKGGDQF